jgi:putative Flp pilus-assembly TadE/G-like protein
MNQTAGQRKRKGRQQGSSLFIVGAAMLALVGLMGLGIDLVALYLGKSEAQRSADAAALAGAQEFVLSGFVSGVVSQATVQTLATNQAIAVGQKNLVGGTAPSIPSGNVTFDFTHAGNPLITVQVGATLPTYFMTIFGVTSANVAATATAEAYNPAGSAAGGPTLCTSCLRPFLVPNCDPDHPVAGGNPNCPKVNGQNQDYFLNPPNYSINRPGAAPTGVVGESWSLHSGGPKVSAASQWYSIAFLGAQSKSAWQADIARCNTDAIVCGTVLQTLNGKAVGPANQGIEALIHATGLGLGQGQDTINVSGGTGPFPMFAGSNNPLVTAGVIASGTPVVQSDSLVTVPVYDGLDTNGVVAAPGGSQVKITGYLQMFITDVNHQGPDDIINGIITNVMSCGANTGGTCATGGNAGAGGGGSGTGGTVTAGGAGFAPVRLVHP